MKGKFGCEYIKKNVSKQDKYSKFNFLVISLFIIALFSLTGCGGGEDLPPPVIDKSEFKKGNGELDIDFMENAPPIKVYDDQMFRIIPKLTNKGAYTIKEGVLVLNTEESYLKIQETSEGTGSNTSNVLEFKELVGKSYYSPEGDHIMPTFDFYARSLEATSKEHSVGVFASACYLYETELTGEVCVDPDIYNQRSIEKVCTNSVQSFSGQGAPIEISSVELKLIPRTKDDYQVQLLIEVTNKGDGKPISFKKLKNICTSEGISAKDLNVIHLDEVRLMGGRFNFKGTEVEEDYDDGSGNLKCSNVPLYLRSTTGEKNIIKCESDRDSEYIKGSEPEKLSQIYIKLVYGYMKTESTKVLIENGDYIG